MNVLHMLASSVNLAEEGEVGGVDVFLPRADEMFWSAVVLIILGVAFYKFFLPNINKALEERSQKIEGGIAEAAELKKEAEDLHEKYSNEIKGARLEAARIQDDARSNATQIIQDAHAKAQADAELISKNASRAIESERKAAETALKKQIGSLAMAMTQKMLNNGLDNDNRQSKMIDKAIGAYGNKNSRKDESSASSEVRERKAYKGINNRNEGRRRRVTK